MRSLRILVIEDDILIGQLLSEMLDGLGHVVCGIETTEKAAIDSASRLKPDLMIVDAQLRSGNGVSAVAAIQRTNHIPHIYMTGGYGPFAPRSIVLKKPFMLAALSQAIQQAWPLSADAAI
jgi:CheY-like chemotaxis protein